MNSAYIFFNRMYTFLDIYKIKFELIYWLPKLASIDSHKKFCCFSNIIWVYKKAIYKERNNNKT